MSDFKRNGKLEVKLDGAGHGTVHLDGKEFKHVRRMTIEMEAGELSVVNLELIAVDAHLELDESDVSIKPVVMCRG